MKIYQTTAKANADGLLGDMTVTLDMPTGTIVKMVIAFSLVFAAYFASKKYLA